MGTIAGYLRCQAAWVYQQAALESHGKHEKGALPPADGTEERTCRFDKAWERIDGVLLWKMHNVIQALRKITRERVQAHTAL